MTFVQFHSSSTDSYRLCCRLSNNYMLVLPQVGNSLLHSAAWRNCSSVIGELLVKAGLDVNIVNKVSSILCDDCTKTRYLNFIEPCDTTYIEDTFFATLL